MHEHQPQQAIFIADAVALDFLNSVATPVDEPVDSIDNGEGLLQWLEQADLVPAEALARLRSQALPGELDAVATQARSLREWFRSFVRAHMGKPIDREALPALESLNRLLERDDGYGRIAPSTSGAGLAWQWQRRWRSPESLLQPIAEALAKFVCEEDLSAVKACEGSRCTLMFADHTRGQRRRWCSTAVCGNRAKVAAHRQRKKEAGMR